MKPTAINTASVTEFEPSPVRRVVYGGTGVFAPWTPLKFAYVTAPRNACPIVLKVNANATIQTMTEPTIAARIPLDWPFVTCLISPPIEIENAAPISGRKAQLAR